MKMMKLSLFSLVGLGCAVALTFTVTSFARAQVRWCNCLPSGCYSWGPTGPYPEYCCGSVYSFSSDFYPPPGSPPWAPTHVTLLNGVQCSDLYSDLDGICDNNVCTQCCGGAAVTPVCAPPGGGGSDDFAGVQIFPVIFAVNSN